MSLIYCDPRSRPYNLLATDYETAAFAQRLTGCTGEVISNAADKTLHTTILPISSYAERRPNLISRAASARLNRPATVRKSARGLLLSVTAWIMSCPVGEY